tara:strand:- start:572 stop:976 length:405 start_codon:yes stop_codon:yes gene_type:complete
VKSNHQVGLSSINIETSIFLDRNFSFSEALVTHLRRLDLSYHEIGVLLNRDDRTIWTLCRRAQKKSGHLEKEGIVQIKTAIPTSIFKDRSISIMEALVEHLRERYSYREIGKMLNRNERTIWTIYDRVKKKRKN